MRAILRKQCGGPDVLEIRETPEPEPKIGHAVANEKSTFMNTKMPERRVREAFCQPHVIYIKAIYKNSRTSLQLTLQQD